VHRDLKLENIMMSSDGDDACVKIADFGLATLLGPTQTASDPYGTLGYTAPEVLKKD
jgi:serine/threonine protein kinase